MFENGTLVKTKDSRQGKIVQKARIPRSKPIAWRYEVEFSDGKREWFGKYKIKPVAENSGFEFEGE